MVGIAEIDGDSDAWSGRSGLPFLQLGSPW